MNEIKVKEQRTKREPTEQVQSQPTEVSNPKIDSSGLSKDKIFKTASQDRQHQKDLEKEKYLNRSDITNDLEELLIIHKGRNEIYDHGYCAGQENDLSNPFQPLTKVYVDYLKKHLSKDRFEQTLGTYLKKPDGSYNPVPENFGEWICCEICKRDGDEREPWKTCSFIDKYSGWDEDNLSNVYQVVEGLSGAKKCKYWDKHQKKIELGYKAQESNLPKDAMLYNLKDYAGKFKEEKQVIQYIKEFRKKFSDLNLYFWSADNNTQKTTVASFIGKKLLEQGLEFYFILNANLVDYLMEEQVGNEDKETPTGDTIKEVLKKCRRCHFLVVDDSWAKDKIIVWKEGRRLIPFHTFLKTRMEHDRKATCFTSNVHKSEIVKTCGKSIQALIDRKIWEIEFRDRINDFDPSELFNK